MIDETQLYSLRVSDKTVWRFVAVTCADGRRGFGEFTLDSVPDGLEAWAAEIGEALLGREAAPGSLHDLLPLPFGGLAKAAVYSAYDQALYDLAAQARDQSLAAFLGAAQAAASIPLYANINRRTRDRSPDGFARSAVAAAAEGFAAVKVAPFDGLDPQSCATPAGQRAVDAGLERVAAVAERVNGAAGLMVDCHWRLSTEAAEALIGPLSSLGVTWLECPLEESAETIDALRRLRSLANDAGMRLAGCETMIGWEGFRPFVEGGAYDVVMPDVKFAGGLAVIVEIAARAAAAGVGVSLHNPSGPVAHLHSLHVSAALEGALPLELQFGESPLFQSITRPACRFERGRAPLPEGIGLGAALDTARLNQPATEPRTAATGCN